MRLLDLFCCAGGAGAGYHRAGFDVVGVDIAPQPHYPFEFHRADALTVLRGETSIDLGDFDAIHASPPCQAYTTMTRPDATTVWPKLIPVVRRLLEEFGRPWVLENVTGARSEMPDAVLLHGGMFGLDVDRPRLFSTPVPLLLTQAARIHDPVAVYGALDGRRLWTRADGTELRAAATLEQGQRAMGIDWMDWDELTEAIPPAYTEFIGRQLIDQLQAVAA